MKKGGSRRDFLKTGAAGMVLAGGGSAALGQENGASSANPETESPLTEETIRSAEAIFDVRYTDAERQMMVDGMEEWIDRMSRFRRISKPNELAPACSFDPRLLNVDYPEQDNQLVRSGQDAGQLPSGDTDIAFAPVWRLSQWIERRQLSSRRLTDIYLERISRHNGVLQCFVTVTPEIARAQADDADREIAAGQYRGALHGIPYGMKDIIDIADIASTWGATPYRDRVASETAFIADRLREAGAVLLGKTTNGAIAYGDIWFDGVTKNPWNPEEGSSGSSAGSASSTAAGLVAFSIGTETLGSIVSPSNRCGTTGLRPTFGRVSRHGAMALCWSLDKIGPITRSVEDAGLVLEVLNGFDRQDPGAIEMGFSADFTRDVRGMRVGFDPAWFELGSDADRATLEAARSAGVDLVEITLPDLPYDALFAVVEAESAAAFEELTLTDQDDDLRWQAPFAWPNTWRQARFISAIDLINVDRFRRQVMREMHTLFEGLDAMIGPNFAGAMLTITNYTGHPQLAIKSGFNEIASRAAFDVEPANPDTLYRVPQTTSLWAPLFQEGNILALGREIENRLGVADMRPPLFS
ncbi:amidase [Maricaulis sp.]|uniref:amidase n=1 Tax=Maricaulis sp. TaxID=1486257 RepID=UPI0025BB4A49|nr:amidase [Maricaulis sp.]